MATSTIENGGLKLDGGTISLFGVTGFIHGDSWVMNVAFGMNVEVDPDPASPNVSKVINFDIEDGNFEKIDHVMVNSNIGVCLYLEGKISNEQVAEAYVDDDAIIFYDVAFDTSKEVKYFNVVVSKNTKHSYATIDKNGKVV